MGDVCTSNWVEPQGTERKAGKGRLPFLYSMNAHKRERATERELKGELWVVGRGNSQQLDSYRLRVVPGKLNSFLIEAALSACWWQHDPLGSEWCFFLFID